MKLGFFGSLIPTVRILVNIPAGLTRMPYPQFALLTFSGVYLWYALLIGNGYVLGVEWILFRENILEQAEKVWPSGIGLLVIIAAGLLLIRDFWHWRKLRMAPVFIPVEDSRSIESHHEN